MKRIGKKLGIKTFHSWVSEAHFVSQEWRSESWRDYQMYDGGISQWTQEDYDNAKAAGLNPLTINRTFPVVNLILGSEALNKYDIVAKARTQDDSEISQVMTESIKFSMDQNNGEFLVSGAFKECVLAGVGFLAPGLNSDPRKEKIGLFDRSWMEMFWDPFSTPWLEAAKCRYVFHRRWMDLVDLQGLFPEKEKELEEQFDDLVGSQKTYGDSTEFTDEATKVEEYSRTLGGGDWAMADRRRVRPVELWYPQWEKCWFAVYPDGRVFELLPELDAREQYAIVEGSESVVGAPVRKMHVATFLGDLILHMAKSPFPHDEFPFVPFVGYLDRYNLPYGLPRQIRGQNEEVNKRRTMALALLKSRQVYAEENAISDPSHSNWQNVHEEANKLDGMVIVADGALAGKKIEIKELGQLAQGQMDFANQSEMEIQEISGSNDDRRGLATNATTSPAIQKRQEAGATMTATLFDNLRRSKKILGSQLVANIQGFWTGQKVLRVTDRLTGADRFVKINEPIRNENGSAISLRNDITQGKYDLVISEAKQSDTVREQNLNLVIEWVKKSPPEVIPHLMNLAFELSNIPNKEQLLARIRPILGINPADEDLSPEEIKEQTLIALEGQKAEERRQAEKAEQMDQLELEKAALENQKLKAEIKQVLDETKTNRAKAVGEMRAARIAAPSAPAKKAASTEKKENKVVPIPGFKEFVQNLRSVSTGEEAINA